MILASIQRHRTRAEAAYAWTKGHAPLLTDLWESICERLGEWMLAGFTLSWGWTLLTATEMFELSPSYNVMAMWMREDYWTALLLIGGACRLGLLIINGHWSKSPHLRMLASASSFWVWLAIAMGFYLAHNGSTGTGIYAICALAELVNIFRAAREAGFNDAKGPGQGNAG